MSKEAMQMALEWFQWFHKGNTIESPKSSIQVKKALEEALAERQGEAVPYGRVTVVRRPGCGDQHWFYPWPDLPYLDNAAECHNVYTHPAPAQQPLSGETVRLAKVALHEMPRVSTDWHEAAKRVCEAVVEAAHGIKETP